MEPLWFEINTPYIMSEEKPCEGAVLLSCLEVDERNVDDPTKIDFYGGTSEWWYKNGINHRLEDGHIKRDEPMEQWFVKLTIEDIPKFLERFKEVTITRTRMHSLGCPDTAFHAVACIDLYEDYRIC